MGEDTRGSRGRRWRHRSHGPAPARHPAPSRRPDRPHRPDPGPGVALTASAPKDLRVLAFDVFGTLLDWRSGLVVELSAIARERHLSIDSAAIADAWRRKAGSLLHEIAAGKRPFRPFEDVLQTAFLLLAREPSISAVPLRDLPRLLQTWHRLPAWPDAAAGLRRLRSCYAV